MKRTLIALSLTVIFLLAGATSPTVAQTVDYPENLKILNFESNSFEPSATGLEANWTAAGNTYVNETTYDFANLQADGYDILLLPRTEGLTSTDVDNIATWFATGNKLVWAGGESDFGGFFDADDSINPLLEEVGSAVRMDAGSIEDPVVNDDAAYRVAPNTVGVSSPLTDYVTEGFDRLIMHGPTAVAYDNGTATDDLRTATLGSGVLANVDVILETSSNAIALDSDLSLGDNDFYAYSDVDGSYPMLVTDQQDGSMIVVSGESIFTDYKFMYGTNDENGGDAHQGSLVVDRLISYFFNVIANAEDDEEEAAFLPFNALFAFLGLSSVMAVIAIRRRN